MRIHLTSEDVAEALLDAGFELRPEDTLTTKFNKVAQDLTQNMQKQMRNELEHFLGKNLW